MQPMVSGRGRARLGVPLEFAGGRWEARLSAPLECTENRPDGQHGRLKAAMHLVLSAYRWWTESPC
eukprot:scaffold153929_cov31-Tisochrysis_lutea.AAC.6